MARPSRITLSSLLVLAALALPATGCTYGRYLHMIDAGAIGGTLDESVVDNPTVVVRLVLPTDVGCVPVLVADGETWRCDAKPLVGPDALDDLYYEATRRVKTGLVVRDFGPALAELLDRELERRVPGARVEVVAPEPGAASPLAVFGLDQERGSAFNERRLTVRLSATADSGQRVDVKGEATDAMDTGQLGWQAPVVLLVPILGVVGAAVSRVFYDRTSVKVAFTTAMHDTVARLTEVIEAGGAAPGTVWTVAVLPLEQDDTAAAPGAGAGPIAAQPVPRPAAEPLDAPDADTAPVEPTGDYAPTEG